MIVSYVSSISRGQFYHYLFVICRHFKYLPVLAILFHVLHIYLAYFFFSINVILIYVPGTSASKPAGRTVFTATTAVKRVLHYMFPFFFSYSFDKDRLHYSLSHPLHTSHHPCVSVIFSSSSGVIFTDVNSFPPAGCTYSNLFMETSSHIGISSGTAKGHTPPG